MKPSPIALFVYNRPKHTRRTIEALAQNILASESDLTIFSDGARAEKDARAVDAVRQYIKTVKGFKSVTVVESEVNRGLAKSIIGGVTAILKANETIVVLEDDMVTSPYFLSYLNKGLELYENDDRVISLNSYMYPVKGRLPATFFMRGADCWGWATWKRGWANFEPDGRKLLDQLVKEQLTEVFDLNNSYPFTQMLRDQIDGLNDSWAIRWQASAFLKNKLTLYPSMSYHKNIGFDDSGVHSGITYVFDTPVQTEPTELQKVEIRELPEARAYLENYYNSIKPTFSSRVKRKLYAIYVTLKNKTGLN